LHKDRYKYNLIYYILQMRGVYSTGTLEPWAKTPNSGPLIYKVFYG